METMHPVNWQSLVVDPVEVIKKINSGMTIFIGTGVSEPLTLFRALKESGKYNLDLEIFQLVSLGDTFVHISDFDMFVQAKAPPIYFDRWEFDTVYDQIAENLSALIDDRSCIGFSIGPLYEALASHLIHKKDLGIHTPFFFDNMMEMVKSGAVTNQYKKNIRGNL